VRWLVELPGKQAAPVLSAWGFRLLTELFRYGDQIVISSSERLEFLDSISQVWKAQHWGDHIDAVRAVASLIGAVNLTAQHVKDLCAVLEPPRAAPTTDVVIQVLNSSAYSEIKAASSFQSWVLKNFTDRYPFSI
jgi:hypothetical protein